MQERLLASLQCAQREIGPAYLSSSSCNILNVKTGVNISQLDNSLERASSFYPLPLILRVHTTTSLHLIAQPTLTSSHVVQYTTCAVCIILRATDRLA